MHYLVQGPFRGGVKAETSTEISDLQIPAMLFVERDEGSQLPQACGVDTHVHDHVGNGLLQSDRKKIRE
jgi:hypothetical protein